MLKFFKEFLSLAARGAIYSNTVNSIGGVYSVEKMFMF